MASVMGGVLTALIVGGALIRYRGEAAEGAGTTPARPTGRATVGVTVGAAALAVAAVVQDLLAR
jgi:hypothetical protein